VRPAVDGEPAQAMTSMSRYPVTVTASYDATRAPRETLDRLKAWATAGDGRTFVVDESIAPVRWTATADYQVDASNAQAAEQVAVDRFSADMSRAGVTSPETVLAATGPLT
jgi:hypothetical protein